MSWAEDLVKEKYKSMGYDIIHTGQPDLILLKNGNIEFVEVKTSRDKIRKHQQEAIDLLVSHGFKARFERVKWPKIDMKPIHEKEQLEIIKQYHRDELEPRDLYNLIIRAQQTPELKNFTRLLIFFFNEKNSEDNTDTFSFS